MPETSHVVELDRLRVDRGVSLSLSELKNADRTRLLALQSQLGLGGEWGLMMMPEDWMPDGGHRFPSMRRVDLLAPLRKAGLDDASVEHGVLVITRLALVYFLKPQLIRRGVVLPSPVTWRFNVRQLAAAVGRALQAPADDAVVVFGRLTAAELHGIGGVYRPNAVAQLLDRLCSLDVWSDNLRPLARSDRLELSRKGSEFLSDRASDNARGYLPLSDSAVAETGWRVAWLIENLGLAVVECLKAMSVAAEATPMGEGKTGGYRRNEALRDLVRRWEWRTPTGEAIPDIPFDLALIGRGGDLNSSRPVWPPVNPVQVLELAKLLQTANLFVFLLCTGGRISEALSLNTGCVCDGDSDYVTVLGRTFKLVFANEGAVRDWPVPKLGADAIEVQTQLAAALSTFGRLSGSYDEAVPARLDSIWTRVGTMGAPITGDYNYHLMKLVRSLGLKYLFEDKSLHAHRFRKTIARLIALAVVGAPKILMDLFGHRTIEMTLHYILTDPAIKSEMAEIAKAQVIMFAKDAVSSAGSNGGPAAAGIRQAAAQERARLGSEFGEEDLHRLAETLTLGGRTWQLVRPGVLCTKGPQQAGACNLRVGHPEPSKCRSHCTHRLEFAALRDDVDRVIDEALENLVRAHHEDNHIMIEYWKGQILANVRRFDDLLAKWSEHPLVAPLLVDSERCTAA